MRAPSDPTSIAAPAASPQTSAPSATAPSLTIGSVALLAGLSLVWGLNWPVMKVVLGELSIWWFRAVCLVVGAFGLLAIGALSGGRTLPTRRDVGPLLFTAVFAVGGWHVCSAFGIALMPAGRAVIIAFTMPVWTALAAAWLLGERVTAPVIAGLVLGCLGLAALIGPDLIVFQTAPLGAVFMLGAAISWGIGTALFKRFSWSIPVAANMGWQLLAASLPVTAIAIALEPWPNWTALSPAALAALAYVLALPMTFGQWAYFSIVGRFPATVAALGTLAIPVVGVTSSAWLLGETIGLRDIVALTLICAALFVVLIVPHIRRARS